MTALDRNAEGEGRRPWFSVYRGEDPSWQVVKHLAPDTRARIFGVLLGRLWIGFMWRTHEPAITEAECRAIAALRTRADTLAAAGQTPPPGHIIDDTGRVRRVLGTLPLTADGCVAGIGAKVINPMGEVWVACVRSYAHEPGAEDDDPNCLLADCRAPLDDPPRRAPPMTPHDRAAEGAGRRPWFSVYRGEDPSWQVVKHLAPDTRARIFGVLLGRLWIGFMWRTHEPAITEAECRAIDAFRRDRQ